jgi:hypothetical protein
MRFFQTKIAERFPDATLTLASPRMPTFSASGILTPDMTPSEKIIYIDLLPCPKRDLPAHVSIITTEARADLYEHCNLIVLPDGTDLTIVVNLMSETFRRYFGWADAVHEAITQNQGLQVIVDLTASIVNNPLYIADSSFKMLASWSGEFAEVNPTWRYQQEYRYLPYQVMQALIDSGELDLIYNTPEAWLDDHSVGFPSLPFISKAIRKDGIHYGNLFIIALYNHLDHCDLEIADCLGTMFSSALCGNRNYLETSIFYHAHFLEDIIEGTLTDRQLMNDQLKTLHWGLEGDYLLALFDTSQDNDAIRHHMMALLSTDLNAQCLSYHGNVLAIFNGYRNHMDEISSRLRLVARDFSRKVATSERFIDFPQIGKYYLQVRFSLDIERSSNAAGRILSYHEVFLDHLVSELDSTIPVFASITLLERHDEEHGTEYCHTLHVWLAHERNTVKAASELYVHRNTLKNRLGHIQDIIGVDTDDFWVRERLLLSLHTLLAQKGVEADASRG